MSAILFHDVRLAYDGRAPVLDGVELHVVAGWTGLVGANGAGKTTLLRAAVRSLPVTGGVVVHDPPDATTRLCEQRVDEPGDDVLCLAAATDRHALRWLRRLALDPVQVDRWSTLSAGERKRWQLAAALAVEPDVLALDEPTNHIDAATRAALVELLRRFRGVGLIVSHDRELLDELCQTTVRVEGGTATSYPGGYSHARALWSAEAEVRRAAWAEADAARRRASHVLGDARRIEAAAARAVSASSRIKGPRDSDGRSMGAKNLAARAAAGAGRVVSRRRRALEEAEARVSDLAMEKERSGAVGLAWESPTRRWLATLDGVTLRAGVRLIARDVHASVARDSRIHVAGDNGAGKSTLLGALVAAATIPRDRLLWLPQELDAAAGQALVRQLADLPADQRGRIGQIAAALGLDPARALASGLPSPGEVRKLAIARGLAQRVWLAVLDEPTNHLDLPSIERLQAALADYPGALVLATHDARFADGLTSTTWRLHNGALIQT